MKMRTLMAGILALVLALCCAAPVVAEDKVTVTIWNTTFTGEQETQLQKIAADFTASQDKYEVVVQNQPKETDTYRSVAEGVGPDIIFDFNSTAAKYVPEGLVANLNEYIYDEEIGIPDFDSLLPEYLIEEMNSTDDGNIHWLPGDTTAPVLFYNKTLLDELEIPVPTTWDELTAACDKIKAAYPDKTPFGIDGAVDFAQTQLLGNGYSYIDMEKKEVGFADAADVFTWFQNQCAKGNFAVTSPSGGWFSDDFGNGSVVMLYASFVNTGYITPVNLEYEVAISPTVAGKPGAIPIFNRGPIVFHYKDQAEREMGAYLFVKYMLTEGEVSASWAEARDSVTPWINAQKVEGYDEYVAGNKGLDVVMASLEQGVTFPAITGSNEVRTAVEELVYNLAGNADANVEEALAACVATCNAALKGE